MPQILSASALSLNDVYRLLGLEQQVANSFTELLSLQPLTEVEHQELLQIRNDFYGYLAEGKVSEGLVKFLTLAPLMRLAGFYQFPIRLTMEESIADIAIRDEDKIITGRMDILAVSNAQAERADGRFWILVIEAKNSEADVFAGLPQLLTYAFKSLEQQLSTWGLVTNGLRYLFVYLKQGTPPTYQLVLPELNLLEPERTIQLLKVLKAICNENTALPV